MSRENGQENANENSHQIGGKNLSTSVGKRIGEALILGVYLVVDALDVWPRSHVGCLVLAFLGVLGLLLLDGLFAGVFFVKRTAILCGIAAVACVIIYFVAPLFSEQPIGAQPTVITQVVPLPSPGSSVPRTYEGSPGIPFADSEVRGVLKPANDPTPANGCDRRTNPLGPEAIKVLLGKTAIAKTGLGRMIAIRIKICEVIAMERREDGMLFDARLFDADGNAVVTIKDNRVTALNGENYTARQSRDEATVVVKNRAGVELFYARFLNPTTVLVRGYFGCSGDSVIHVAEGQPIVGTIFMDEACFVDAHVGIQIGKPPTEP